MRSFQLKIVAIDRVIYDGDAVYCGVVTREGTMGIEAGHEPAILMIKSGSAVRWRITESSDDEKVFVGSGMLSFKKSNCIVTVDIAE